MNIMLRAQPCNYVCLHNHVGIRKMFAKVASTFHRGSQFQRIQRTHKSISEPFNFSQFSSLILYSWQFLYSLVRIRLGR